MMFGAVGKGFQEKKNFNPNNTNCSNPRIVSGIEELKA